MIPRLFISTLLVLLFQPALAQKTNRLDSSFYPAKRSYAEAGIGITFPAHDDMWKTHRVAVGVNAWFAKRISAKIDLGMRTVFEYYFARMNLTDSTVNATEGNHNFSILGIRPGLRYYLPSHIFFGVEAGVGFVLLDGHLKTGFGFVEEYHSGTQLGFSSGLNAGKYFAAGRRKRVISLSVKWINFFARTHAENFAGLTLDYRFGTSMGKM